MATGAGSYQKPVKPPISTGLCDSGKFSTLFRVDSPLNSSLFRVDSWLNSSLFRVDLKHVVKDQVVTKQVVVARLRLWINSLKTKEKPPEAEGRKDKIKTFLIGKELKIKDLLHTAERLSKRIDNKINPKPRIKTPG